MTSSHISKFPEAFWNISFSSESRHYNKSVTQMKQTVWQCSWIEHHHPDQAMYLHWPAVIFSTIWVAELTIGISTSSSLPNIDIFSSFSKTAERCFWEANKFHINILIYLLKSKVSTDARQPAHYFKSSPTTPIKSDWR